MDLCLLSIKVLYENRFCMSEVFGLSFNLCNLPNCRHQQIFWKKSWARVKISYAFHFITPASSGHRISLPSLLPPLTLLGPSIGGYSACSVGNWQVPQGKQLQFCSLLGSPISEVLVSLILPTSAAFWYYKKIAFVFYIALPLILGKSCSTTMYFDSTKNQKSCQIS